MGFVYPPSGSSSLTAMTISQALGNGSGVQGGCGTTQQGWLFDITSGLSSNLTAGAVYTNNGHSYTALVTLPSTDTGQILFVSGTGATSGTTLTLSSGTGPSTIAISQTAPNAPLATYLYTVPTGPTPLYIRVRMCGGGGGGGGSTGGAIDAGASGLTTIFGTLFLACTGGSGATTSTPTSGGLVFGTSPWTGSSFVTSIAQFNGGAGGGGGLTANTVGGMGGTNPFGGGGANGGAGNGATAGVANTGAGGGGAGMGSGNTVAAAGGGAGAYQEFIITSTNLASSYLYAVGTGGAGGSGSTYVGGAGATGQITIEEHYQ